MATKARLHWFWRGAIAVLAGVAGLAGLLAIIVACDSRLRPLGRRAYIMPAMGLLLGPLPGIVTYGLLTGRYGPNPDGELHCRRCDHILRGLSEPRCPECGEAI